MTRAAMRWIPQDRANDLARNIVTALLLDPQLAPIMTIQSAILARMEVLVGADGSTWTWPEDADPSAVADALFSAWREVTA